MPPLWKTSCEGTEQGKLRKVKAAYRPVQPEQWKTAQTCAVFFFIRILKERNICYNRMILIIIIIKLYLGILNPTDSGAERYSNRMGGETVE
ncbi:hypothetical protein HMPREF9413_4350 [Paenibacillus sp. HGF7]|nr:hypothetical protein HMPREF9413_4350 [Paenibacillus sp. HGF7]